MTQHASNHPTFAEVAHLIAPNNTPIWLPAYLEWSSQGLRYDQLVEEIRQTKAKTKERLEAFQEASLLILRELGAPVRDFLEIDPLGPIKNTSDLNVGLMDLAKARRICRSFSTHQSSRWDDKAGAQQSNGAWSLFSKDTLCCADFRRFRTFSRIRARTAEFRSRRCGRGLLARVRRPVQKLRKPSDRLASPLRNGQDQRENAGFGTAEGCLATRS